MFEKPPCEKCRKIWAKENKEPDCQKCIPKLMPQNMDVADVYWCAKNQVKLDAMGRVIDLDYAGVKALMDMMGIEHGRQREIFNKVLEVFWHYEFLRRGRN